MRHLRNVALRLRQHRPVDVLVRSTLRYRAHRGAHHAALISYYGFLTLFPALLLATTVLGFVLQGNPSLRADIINSAVSDIPVIGREVLSESGGLRGSGFALVIGVLGAIWGSTRAFVIVQVALDDIVGVPADRRHSAVIARVHALVGVAIIGVGQVASLALTTLATHTDINVVSSVLLALGTVAINTFVVGSMFRYLTSAETTFAHVWPGALAAGLAYTTLQVLGSTIVARLLAGAQGVYGTFASVLAITGWLAIHATVALFAAELNAELASDRQSSDDFGITG